MSSTLRKVICLACLSLGAFATQASAAPVWNLDIHHMPTNFTPGAGVGATINPTPPVAGCTPIEGSASEDEVQCLVVKALGGKFKLTLSPQSTSDLDFDSSAAEVQAALGALPAIGAGNVSVSGGPGDLTGSAPYAIVFTGTLSHTDVAQLTTTPATSLENNIGGAPQYTFDIQNVGSSASYGITQVVINLPTGVTRASVWANNGSIGYGGSGWSCPGSVGDTSLICITSNSFRGHETETGLTVAVDVDPDIAAGTKLLATAQVTGGGAAFPSPNAFERTTFSSAPAPFGLLAESFAPGFFEANGLNAVTQSGAHPALFTTPFDINSVDAPSERNHAPDAKRASGALRNITADLPPGFVGDPTALPECATPDFLSSSCPGSTQVGKIEVSLAPTFQPGYHYSFVRQVFAVFNLVPAQGVAADFGFQLLGNPIHIRASLDSARNYSVSSSVPNLNESFPPFNSKLILWGVPADPSHDNERCLGLVGEILLDQSCGAGVPRKAFLTAPFECAKVPLMGLSHYDSWEDTGSFGTPLIKKVAGVATNGCAAVPFAPTVSVAPSTNVADSPSGLDVRIESPQSEDPDQLATAPLRDATVTLPEGITVNPASANGLDACTPAQIGLGTDNPIGCPEAARVADVEVVTPVLPDPVGGTVYLASPHDNPFGSLLAAYLVLSEPERGILVKIPGRVEADPDTGQLTGIFKDNPQLPFSKLELHFKAGAHASLITPKTCGAYEAKSELGGWAGNPPTQGTSAFQITQGPAGPCPSQEAELPNSPSFDAGPTSPVSRSYSPFVLHLRRQDGSQRFGAFNVTLPQGLTGKLAGTSLCPDAALSAAESKGGREEQASPSCPLNSRVGTVHAAVGAGPDPYNAKGTAYLAGPYKGAPLSLAVLTPAVAGPFDLGTIVIRTPLRIDPKTAQLTAVSDPIPQMLEGIPTDVRSVDVFMDRPDFTLTGTSCDPAQIAGQLTSTLGQSVPLAVRYQLSDCSRLGFAPKLRLSLRGDTKRGGHPALTVILEPRAGDANIASLSLAMPRSEFLDQAHIKTICTRVQFAADQCPAAAVYGKATVTTPLLDYALAGNVYLRSSDNLLPDLVPDLRGPAHQPVKIEAAGRTDSIRGGIRNSFDFVPDAPFTKLVTKLPGGAKGLLVNSRDICAKEYRATAIYTAHNGDRYVDHPVLKAKCEGKARKGSGKHKSKKHAHKRAR